MNKKLLLVVGIVAIALAIGGVYVMRNQDDVQNETVQETVDYEQIQQSYASFEMLQKSYATKDYEAVVANAPLYGADAANDEVSRLNAYVLCIQSAQELAREQVSTDCYAGGVIIANGLADADASKQWESVLNALYNKQLSEGESNGPQ